MTYTLSRRKTVLSACMAGALALAGRAKAQSAAAQSDTARSPRPSFETFIKNPYTEFFCISPNADKIAFVMQKGDNKILAFMDIDGGNKGTMNMGTAKVRRLIFADNDTLLLENSSTTSLREFTANKIEAFLAHLINVKTRKMTTLFDGMENFYPIVVGDLGVIKVNGETRVTASSILMDHDHGVYYRPLYSFPTKGGVAHLITTLSVETTDVVLKPDGTPAAYAEYDAVNLQWRLFINTNAAGSAPRWKLIYTAKTNTFKIDLAGLGRTDETLSIVLYDDKGAGVYYEIDANGKLSEPLFNGDDAADYSALFHPRTRYLAGFRLHKDWVENHYFDPTLKKISDALISVFDESDHVYIDSFADDVRKVIVYAESNVDAGSYYFIDLSTGRATFLAKNYPDIPVDWLSHKDIISYTAGDGLAISAYLSLPPYVTAKALPLVVMPHGGPRARDYADFDAQVQCLTAAGYAVLQPNFRGSIGYGASFVQAGNGEWGRKMQTDLSDGVRYLVGKGLVDAKRVSIMGASYGGYAALAGATLDRGVYNAAIAIAGVSDLITMMEFEQANNNWQNNPEVSYWKDLYGPRDSWAAISPARQAANAYCPVLIFHGRDDSIVPFEQGQRMANALRDAGKTYEFVPYERQDHNESNQADRVDMIKRSLDFLAKYNPA
ncbi:alpha/beta hydrolase family protein [Asticcacaulis sp. 201]|uniref:alpha/beta hydrolase family protein n=1 Tax=Asticcacaulis sp. 201 TaxID=3028787 RepID=UPI002916F9BE|nr:prolyl oligopeptidase family serine peptidase [Asticcacaulis sp. 201]MDV6330044.1 prolyl oligopeptidase family serine peptidase [Asticcacaulis sp. 201]